MRKTILSSALLLCCGCPFLRAQIWSGIWVSTHGSGTGTSCNDVETNATAACTLRAYCTDPPNPIPGFDIAGSVSNTCPNQPVNNGVDIWKADSMTEKVEAFSIAYFYGRTIFDV